MLGRLKALADPTKPIHSAPKRALEHFARKYERNRSVWQFMAWSFIVAETLAAGAWLSGVAHTPSDDDDSNDHAPLRVADGAAAAPQFEPTTGGDGDKDADGSGSQSLGVTGDSGPGSFDYLGSAGTKMLGSGTSFVHSHIYSGIEFYRASEMHGIPSVGLPPGVVHVTPFDASTLDYFGGLKAFTDGLGFGDNPLDLATAAPGSAAGALGVALQFAENPFTPVAFWESLGRLDPNVQPLMRDSVSTDWLVQLNGMKDGHIVEADQVKGFEQAEHSIARDYDGNTFATNASVVDGNDWSGTLWVKGNYYEFNTIVQVNILWDNDNISFQDFQSAGGTPGNLAIKSGGNQQVNTASIGAASDPQSIDAHAGADGVHQIVMGGRTEASSAIQINTIVDLDSINFNVDQLVGDALGSIDFASIYSAGLVQQNISSIVSDNDNTIEQMSPSKFLVKGPVQYVNGDYYEFNTVIQINVITDADQIAETLTDSNGAQPGGVIASGGTMQFNNASIAKNDHYDDLYVRGQYSQYNLVLQVNAMQDNDTITELRGTPAVADHNGTTTGPDGSSGGDGDHAATISTPSVQDDHLMRAPDLLLH